MKILIFLLFPPATNLFHVYSVKSNRSGAILKQA